MEQKPELILKESYLMYGARDSDTDVPIPAFKLWGNAAGYRYLAEFFSDLAEKAEELSEEVSDDDPRKTRDDHEHLNPDWDESFNRELSDLIEIRCDIIGPANREHVLSQWKISSETRQIGSIAKRWPIIIERAERHLAQWERIKQQTKDE